MKRDTRIISNPLSKLKLCISILLLSPVQFIKPIPVSRDIYDVSADSISSLP